MILNYVINWTYIVVIFNEPLSFLQRIVEYGDYINLIAQAAKTDDPIKRIEVKYVFLWFHLSSTTYKLVNFWFSTPFQRRLIL